MDGSAATCEPTTRKVHFRNDDGLPKIRRSLEDRQSSDPVVLYAMGILESDVAAFGTEVRSLMASGSLDLNDARYSILVHVAIADSGNSLSLAQMERLISTGFTAAGLTRASFKTLG